MREEIMEKIKVLRIDKDVIKLAKDKIASEDIIITVNTLNKQNFGRLYYSSKDGFYADGLFQGNNYLDFRDEEGYVDYFYIIITEDDLKVSIEYNMFKDYLNFEEISIDNDLIKIDVWE